MSSSEVIPFKFFFMCCLDTNSSSSSISSSSSSSNDKKSSQVSPPLPQEDKRQHPGTREHSMLVRRRKSPICSASSGSISSAGGKSQKVAETEIVSSTEKHYHPKKQVFTVGGLRIAEFHGITGATSLCLSTGSIAYPTCHMLVFAATLLSSVVAIHADTLLDQVPLQTTICRRPVQTVAPHRDAFRRTSIILLYVNARILALLLGPVEGVRIFSFDYSSLISTVVISFCCLRMYFPWKPLDWTNGNTYCFVVPMMVGVFGDYVVTMTHYENNLLSLSHTDQDNWLSVRELLVVQWSGLIIAFLFTLAFRKHISIRWLYWIASIAVNLMTVVGILRAANLFIGSF